MNASEGESVMGQFKLIPSREKILNKIPDYEVAIKPCSKHIRVKYQEHVIADSVKAIFVKESKHTPIYYFPREDVRMDLLEATEQDTYCPFKGHASYWSLFLNGQVSKNLVWSYETPYEEVVGLKDYMAFYEDRTDMEIN